MVASRNAHNRPDALPRLFDASEMSQCLDVISAGAVIVIKQSFWRKLKLVRNM
jgi:hypothetical protein